MNFFFQGLQKLFLLRTDQSVQETGLGGTRVLCGLGLGTMVSSPGVVRTAWLGRGKFSDPPMDSWTPLNWPLWSKSRGLKALQLLHVVNVWNSRSIHWSSELTAALAPLRSWIKPITTPTINSCLYLASSMSITLSAGCQIPPNLPGEDRSHRYIVPWWAVVSGQ